MNPPAQNLAQNSAQILVDMINRANLTSFQLADLSFAAPVAGTVAGKNTDVTVTAQGNGTTWAGSATVHYNRLDLGALFAATGAQVELQPGWATTQDLLGGLNAAYGLGMSSDDIVSAALPGSGYPQLVTLTAKPTSLAFTGSYQVMVVDYNGSAPAGTTVVPYHTTNATLGAPFVNGSSKLLLDGATVDGHFWETTNEEVILGARAYDNTVGPIDGDNTGRYTINPVAGNAWHAELVGAVPAGSVVTALYDVALSISDGTETAAFVLTHDGSGFHLVDAGNAITLPVAYSAADGSQFQAKIDVFAQLASVFSSAVSNGAEFQGNFAFTFTATKKGAAKPVVNGSFLASCAHAV